MECFAKTVNGFQSLTIFHLDIWQSSEYAPAKWLQREA